MPVLDEGVLTWPFFLKEPQFFFAGQVCNGRCEIVPSGEGGAGGTTIDMMSAGVRFQKSGASEFAPSGAEKRLTFSLTWTPTLLEATRHAIIERANHFVHFGQAKLAVGVTIADVWPLDGDGRIQWTLSHSMPSGTLPYIEPPLVEITERDGTPVSTLTVITSGIPTATEVLVDAVADSDVITTIATGPGDPAQGGKLFSFTYYPFMTVVAVTPSWTLADGRLLDTLEIEVAAFQKDWDGDNPAP